MAMISFSSFSLSWVCGSESPFPARQSRRLCCSPDSLAMPRSSKLSMGILLVSFKAANSSPRLIPISLAISSSSGERPSLFCSFCTTLSMAEAFCLTDRGTQSIDRNSSRIAPRTLNSAYVLNLAPRDESYLSIASINPKTPTLIKSSTKIWGGRRMAIRFATYLTIGAYSLITASRFSTEISIC